jgi:hypothetical protein
MAKPKQPAGPAMTLGIMRELGVEQLIASVSTMRPAHPTMERCRDRHCSATLLLASDDRTRATSYLLGAPENWPAPAQVAGLSLPPSLTQAAPGSEGAGDPVEAIEPLVTRDGGTPMKTPAPAVYTRTKAPP